MGSLFSILPWYIQGLWETCRLGQSNACSCRENQSYLTVPALQLSLAFPSSQLMLINPDYPQSFTLLSLISRFGGALEEWNSYCPGYSFDIHPWPYNLVTTLFGDRTLQHSVFGTLAIHGDSSYRFGRNALLLNPFFLKQRPSFSPTKRSLLHSLLAIITVYN